MTSDPTDTENELADDAPAGEGPAEGEDEGLPGAAGDGDEVIEGADIAAELEELKAEFDVLNDRHLRLAAEFTNYRRRADAERIDTWGKAQADLLRRFVEVLDDLQRVSGLDPADEAVTVESIVEGVDLVERKFLRAVQDSGAEVIDPGDGEPFDPEIMEAMMRVPTDHGDLDDRVSQVFQKGYLFQGHLVRPARVSVYKAD